jgi:hypothetical protein
MIVSPPRCPTGRGTNPDGPNEEETADKVSFNTPSFRRIRTPVMPAATTARPDLVAGTAVTPAAGSWQATARGRSQQTTLPRYTMVVNVEVRCIGEGDIRVMVPDLLFEGLKTLKEEDKDVCFLHPDNFCNQARKRTDMLAKFQRIHKEWANFEEPLAIIKSKLKWGNSKFFNSLSAKSVLVGEKLVATYSFST